MTLNRLLITSVVVENRPVRDVAAQYGVSESWLFELLARYHGEGETAVEPRSRRPHGVPTTTPAETINLIVELREKLTATGLDAGPDTIKWHLEHHHATVVSRATISGYLTRHGLVIAEPKPPEGPWRGSRNARHRRRHQTVRRLLRRPRRPTTLRWHLLHAPRTALLRCPSPRSVGHSPVGGSCQMATMKVIEGEPKTILSWLVDCDLVVAPSDVLDEGMTSSGDPSRL
jgi:hypothetical protein